MRGGCGHHPSGRSGGPQLGRYDDERLVGGLQRHHGRVVQLSGQVDHHEVPPASGRVDGRRHGGHRQRQHLAAVPGEHHEITSAGQGLHQRRGVHPSVGAGERRPAQAFQLLPAQHEVEATAERVGVDQEGAQSGPGGGHRKTTGEHTRARTAPTTEDRDDPGADASRTVRVMFGEPVDQPRLRGRQRGDVLGPDQLGDLPAGVELTSPAEQHQPGPLRQPGAQAGLRLIGAEQHQGRGKPTGTGSRWVAGELHLGPAHGGEPEHIIEQIVVAGDDQREPADRRNRGTGWHRGLQRSGSGMPPTVLGIRPPDRPDVVACGQPGGLWKTLAETVDLLQARTNPQLAPLSQ
ncbi:hypothetical protein PSN01_05431 [Micromonospora saelicesensis]|nr:hypothetical protein PSN01_05431 [Micromonospora saelicesensis]